MSLLTLVVMLALDSGMKAAPTGVGPDAGVRMPQPNTIAGRVVKPEDQEVIDNLELLENMSESSDLDLLQELSVER